MCRYHRATVLFVLSFLLFSGASAHFRVQDFRKIVQRDGFAEATFAIPFVPKEAGETIVRTAVVYSKNANIITSARVDGGGDQTNLNVLIQAEGDVGLADFVVEVETDCCEYPYEYLYTLEVIGVAVSNDQGRVISGEKGVGITFDSYMSLGRGIQLTARAYGGRGELADMARWNFTIRDPKKTGLLTNESFEAKGSSLKITPNKNRVGKVELEIKHPDLEYLGKIPSTIVSIVVGEKPYPNPVVMSASQPTEISNRNDNPILEEIANIIDGSVSEASANGSSYLQMLNLVDRPDVPVLVAVRGMVEKESLFAMDEGKSSLKSVPQEIFMVPTDLVAKTGVYRVDNIEAEYEDGTVLQAVLEVPVRIAAVFLRQKASGSETVSGGSSPGALAWAPAVGIGAAFFIAVAILGLVLWRRSASDDPESESESEAEDAIEDDKITHALSQASSSGGHHPTIVWDSYART